MRLHQVGPTEAALETALALGPVAVSLDADGADGMFRHYKSGVFDDTNCGTNLDHAPLVVGYTADYWILKNSWGTDGNPDIIFQFHGVS